MLKIVKTILGFKRKLIRNPVKIAEHHKKNGVKMGHQCQVFGGVSFGSEPYLVHLGNKVKITNGCQFITHDGGVNVLRNVYPECKDIDVFGRITLGNNVFLGNRVVVLPNVKIGDNVVIGAGSIVTRDIPSNSVAAGVPCKVVRSLEEYKERSLEKADFTKSMNATEKESYLTNKFNLK